MDNFEKRTTNISGRFMTFCFKILGVIFDQFLKFKKLSAPKKKTKVDQGRS